MTRRKKSKISTTKMALNFKSFIQESNTTASEKMVDDAMPYLLGPASTALRAIKNGDILYRAYGTRLKNSITLLDTSGMKRVSHATNNIYQLMMDSSSSLKSFPSRSNSLFCSTTIGGTKIYGHPYIILPFNETDLALSSSDDFLTQDIEIGGETSSVGDISDAFYNIFKNLNIAPHVAATGKFTDLKSVDRELSKIDFKDSKLRAQLINQARHDDERELIGLMSKAPKDSILTTLADKLFAPGKMSIQLVRFGSPLPDTPKEVWFSGKALAFRPSAFIDLLNNLKGQGYAVHEELFSSIQKHTTKFD